MADLFLIISLILVHPSACSIADSGHYKYVYRLLCSQAKAIDAKEEKYVVPVFLQRVLEILVCLINHDTRQPSSQSIYHGAPHDGTDVFETYKKALLISRKMKGCIRCNALKRSGVSFQQNNGRSHAVIRERQRWSS